jgi:DNA invertase Pin-like site-specific DNA recombinase
MILDSYARESRKGARYVSTAGQHAANLARIRGLGAELGKPLEDEGRSAWLPDVERPGWQELIARLESGVSDGVVIFDVERLLRRVEDAFFIVKLAQRGFKVYDSEMEYDLQTASGQKAFYEAAIAAQYHSHRLSTRVKRGNKDKALRGEGRTGCFRGLGFNAVDRDGVKTIEVNEYEAQHVRVIVDRLLSDPTFTMQNACDYLTSQGIRTDAGAMWSTTSLRNALKKPAMAGYTTYHREIVGTMDGDPVIDPVQWQMLLARFKANRGRPMSPVALCAGKVRCAECGGRISATGVGRGKRYPDGEEFRVYRCRLEPWACMKTIADMRVLDRVVMHAVVDALSDSHTKQMLAAQAEASEEARKPILAELARLEEVREYWGNQLIEGRITLDHHDKMIASLESRIKRNAEDLDRIAVTPMPVDIPNPREEWENATIPQRRELIDRAYTDRGLHIAVYSGPSTEQDILYRVKLISDADLQELISRSSNTDRSED